MPYKGRIEIEIGNMWGSVDDRGWDIYDSTVACKQLGFAGAVGTYSGGMYGNGLGPVWISGVECQGHETRLSRCKHKRLQTFNASHDDRRDASVECYGTLPRTIHKKCYTHARTHAHTHARTHAHTHTHTHTHTQTHSFSLTHTYIYILS